MNISIWEYFLQRLNLKRGLVFGLMIILALLSFEVFNFTTTDFALKDLLGDLTFVGLRWSIILSVAFCGIDFAGIARLFTPEKDAYEPAETWYLFAAWLLAATMNAMLTWWGVSLAILNHETLGNAVIDRATLLRVVPIFVAVMVWLIRVLVIGSFSLAGERLFSQPETSRISSRKFSYSSPRPDPEQQPEHRPSVVPTYRPVNKPSGKRQPTYEPVPMQSYRPVNKPVERIKF